VLCVFQHLKAISRPTDLVVDYYYKRVREPKAIGKGSRCAIGNESILREVIITMEADVDLRSYKGAVSLAVE